MAASKGISAAAASGAPIGDMAIQIGNAFLGGNGFAFMLVIAFTVAIAILGTTLAAMNTGVRISFAMAQDCGNARHHGPAARQVCHPLLWRGDHGDHLGHHRLALAWLAA